MEPIPKKKKMRCNKKMDNLVPISLEETTQAMTKYELNTLCQIAIAESLGKISVGNDGGYINLGMTTRAASPDGSLQVIISFGLVNKVSVFMRQNDDCPKLDQHK
jgi:hypothetical protein